MSEGTKNNSTSVISGENCYVYVFERLFSSNRYRRKRIYYLFKILSISSLSVLYIFIHVWNIKEKSKVCPLSIWQAIRLHTLSLETHPVYIFTQRMSTHAETWSLFVQRTRPFIFVLFSHSYLSFSLVLSFFFFSFLFSLYFSNARTRLLERIVGFRIRGNAHDEQIYTGKRKKEIQRQMRIWETQLRSRDFGEILVGR